MDRQGRLQVTSRRQQPAARYEIRVQGMLDGRWSSWFGGLMVGSEGPDVTVIAGDVPDQAALHGLLTKVSNLGLTLISVHRTDDPAR